MSAKSNHSLVEPDVFDVLSATWVMASNDEKRIITYEGIRYRLGLSSSFDIRKLVKSRGDLFSQTVSQRRLDEWKDEMRRDKNLPSWIRHIKEEVLKKRTIEELTVNDVFRSQFRGPSDAPPSSIQVIDWGLQHIDRLRKASHEAGVKSATRTQMWILLGVGILNMIATIVAAFLKK